MTSKIGVKKIQYPNGTDILTLDSSGSLAIGGGDVTFDSAGAVLFDKSDQSLKFGDNYKAKFGASGDLEIYHDTVNGNSVIHDNGSGNLRIRADDFQVTNAAASANLMFANDATGEVKLYHNGSEKLATASTGVAITGGVAIGGTGSANLLNDYEEGTFTPTLVSTSSTFQYSVQQGIYTKVGDLVTFNIVIQLDGGGNSFSSNSVALNGWPFANRNSQGAHARFFIHGRYLNVDTSGGYYYAFADLNGNSSSAPLKEGGDNIPIASLGANRLSSSSGQLYLQGHYYTDA